MQVVIRLRSIQSLERIQKGVAGQEDMIIGGSGEGRKLVEFIVLQRMMIEGEERPWMVWGTTQESKVADVLGEETEARPLAQPSHEISKSNSI